MDDQQEPTPLTEQPEEEQTPLTPRESEQPAETDQPTQPLAATPAQQPRRKTKKRIISIIMGLIVIGAALGYYKMTQDKVAPQTVSQQPQSAVNKSDANAAELPNRLKFQLGNKILSYDLATKKQEVVTASLPEKTRVLDFYQDSQTWRAYYEVSGDTKTSYWFIEKDAQPVQLATVSFSFARASAKQRLLAYTTTYSIDDKATVDEKTSRTYVVQNGKATEIWRSAAQSSGSDSLARDDPKSPLFLVSDISGDGSKLLFDRANCLYCDGGSSATSFELKIATKTTQKVMTSTKNGDAVYGSDGVSILASETDDSGIGGPVGPADMTITHFAKAGASGVVQLSVSSTAWGHIDFAKDYSAMFAYKPTADISSNNLLEGFYSVGGSTNAGLKKQTLAGLPAGFLPSQLSGLISKACYGAVLNQSNQSNTKITKQVGTFCVRTDGTTLDFSKLDDISWDVVGGSSQNVSVL